MPKGIPNPKPPTGAQSNTAVMDEPEAESPVTSATAKAITPPMVARSIPVASMPGKAIKVTEYGYDFQNIHIANDVPVHVLAQAFVARLGEGESASKASEKFFEAQSFINLFASSKSKQRVRVLNGVVQYGAESFPVPLISPEVILRVIDDRWTNDRNVRSFFAGTKEVNYAKSKKSIKETYALL